MTITDHLNLNIEGTRLISADPTHTKLRVLMPGQDDVIITVTHSRIAGYAGYATAPDGRLLRQVTRAATARIAFDRALEGSVA